MNETAEETKLCRWGIMSTATIGRKNWQAIKLSGNGTVVAVASRNAASSEAYINECQSTVPFDPAPRAVEGYEQLLRSDDIDAVYIPLPTGMRKQWVIQAAEAGKHVMCEKPCARDAGEVQEMIAACEKNNVQFMDGVMYMHGNRLSKLREVLDQPQGIGKLKRIATQFSFCADQDFKAGNIRTNSDLEPLGCLGDLGWYTIRFALWVMNYEMPISVSARMLTEYKRDDSPAAVPMEISAELRFKNGVSASFYNSFLTGHQQLAHISGTEGNLHLLDFVLPFKGTDAKFSLIRSDFVTNGCDFEMLENREDFVVAEPGNSATDSQETNLFRHFNSIVNSGQMDPHWPAIALKTQKVMDACFQSAKSDGQSVSMDG